MNETYYISDIPYVAQENGEISAASRRYLIGKPWAERSRSEIKKFDINPFIHVPSQSRAALLGLNSAMIAEKLLTSELVRAELIDQMVWFDPIPHDAFDLFFWITTAPYALFETFTRSVTMVVNYEAIQSVHHGGTIKTLEDWAGAPIAIQLIRAGFRPKFKELISLKRLDANLLEKHTDFIRQVILGALPEPFYARIVKKNPLLSNIRKRDVESLGVDVELFMIVCDRVAQDLDGWQHAAH